MHSHPASIVSAAVAAVLVAAAGAPAVAAVRVCQPAVAVGPFAASTEVEGKRLALAAWVKEAGRHGRQFTSWNFAVNKELKCLPGDGGGVRCAARGEPCRIQQNPTRRPRPGTKPIET